MYRDDCEALHARVRALESELELERARRTSAEAQLTEALARDYEELIDTKVVRRGAAGAPGPRRPRQHNSTLFELLLPVRGGRIALLLGMVMILGTSIGIGLAVRWLRLKERANVRATATVRRTTPPPAPLPPGALPLRLWTAER